MIVVGLGVIFLGIGNGGQPVGLANLTARGGFFAGGWKGFLFALCIVVASYQGVELVGIMAGEAKDPQVTLRRAISNILWRILIFYVGAIFVIVTLFPWSQIGANGSTFVLTFAKIGITAAAGVTVSIVVLLVGSCLNYVIPNPLQVFVYIYSAIVLPGMVPWFVVLISQLRFRRRHHQAMRDHPFRSVLFPWVNYITMAFLCCVLLGMALSPDTRMSLTVGGVFLLSISLIYRLCGLGRRSTPSRCCRAAV